MKRKKRDINRHNTEIAIVFFIFVISIVLISLIFKAILIFRQSNFDGNHRFTISVSNNKHLEIISFSPNTHSISVLKLDGEIKNVNVNRFLEIPIDGFVKASFLDTNREAVSLMSNILFSYKEIKTNLTIMDSLRLFLFSRYVSPNYVYIKHISQSLSPAEVDKIIGRLLSDDSIDKENMSIEIVNATSVSGLGGRLARLITNIGGNVVQVSTKNPQKTSMILYNDKITYTIERLSKVLGFKITEMAKRSLADVIIVIGEDSQVPTTF